MGGQENGVDMCEPNPSFGSALIYKLLLLFANGNETDSKDLPKGYGIAQIVLCMGALSSGHGFCPLCVVPSDVSLLHLNTYALSPGGHVHSVS